MCVYFEHNIIMSIRISEENKYIDYISKIQKIESSIERYLTSKNWF